ncbi:MAG TPA: hypothetical protein O0X66_02880 [Methanocorpusculum sp.]|nr:hypothetical protein [Methanocorpusculum sp.]
MLHPPLFCIMQAEEHNDIRKTITVLPDVHRRIAGLRRGDQTYGDVVAASIAALERELGVSVIPVIDDKCLEELDEKEAAWDADPDTHYSSFDEIDKLRAKQKGKV